jgi:TPR repeat protein
MRPMSLRQFLFALPISLLMLSGAAPARAGYNEGVAAYKKGEAALAAKEFLPLAQAGNAQAQVMLAQILMNGGKGVTKDVKTGMQWVRRSAEANNADAQIFLAQALLQGLHEQAKDAAGAARWFERAAQAGDQRAMLPLAQMKLQGVGMPADPQGAVPWLEILAAANNAAAHEILGTMALQGNGMEKDYAKAARHLEIAVRQGDQSSAFVLGQLHLKGLGVAKNTEEGMRLISQSANAGNYQAMVTLASVLANGSDDVDQDSRQAYKWITIVLNRAPQGDLFYSASGIETALRSRLSSRQIEAAQAEASRFVVTPMKANAK